MAFSRSEGQIINSSSSNNNSSSPNNNSSSGASGGPSRPTPALESQLQKLIIRQVVSQFIKSAERKLSEIDCDALDRENNLSLSIMPGYDEDFDAKIRNLAQIASQCPKLMIDSIMIWRGQRRNQAAELVAEMQTNKYPNVSLKDLENRFKRRISLMANFILCRVLISIIQNLGSKPLHSELGTKLEDMVFGQLRSADPEQTARFVNLEVNVKLFSQLMGTLSNTRFPTISDRFVTEIRNIQGTDKAAEGKLELMIKSMHYLKLKIYPMNALEESADFLQAISDLFQDSASTKIKLALCDLFNDLLEPVARIADAEVNIPVWQKTIELIAPKVMKMQKGKNLNTVLSLMATLLTVSKKEYFLKSWQSLVETLMSNFRERSLKSGAIHSTCKLLWTYLFRCFEPPSSIVQKKIDHFLKVLFPPKHAISPTECNLDVFVRIVYFILVKYPEYGNDQLISYLLITDIDPRNTMETDSFSIARADNILVLEELPNADRLLIAFRAFILILRDVEQSISDKFSTTAGAVSAVQSKAGLVLVEGKINLTQPNFPTFEDQSDYSFERLSKIGSRDGRKNENDHPLNLPLARDTKLRMGSSMRGTLNVVNSHIGQAFLSLDNVIGTNMLTEPPEPAFINSYIPPPTGSSAFSTSLSISSITSSNYISSYMSTASGSPTAATGNPGRASAMFDAGIPNRQDNFSTAELLEGPPETAHQIYTRLLQTIMDSLPRFYPNGIAPVKVIEMLTRYAVFHYDSKVQQSAFDSICRISKVKRIDPDASDWKISIGNEMISASVFRIFNEAALLAIRTHFSDLWMQSGKFERVSECLAKRKLALLDIWLEDISTSTTYIPAQDDVDSIVQFVESQGLFYLCGVSPNLRKTGIKMLKKSQNFRAKLLEKLPSKKVEDTTKKEESDSLERLSIFHGGKRASLYKRTRSDNIGEERRYISIYDIMEDQGGRIVREYASEGLKKDNPLLFLAQSSDEMDIAMWNRCCTPFLKSLVDFASKECLKKTLIMIWGFLQVMQPILHTMAEEITIYRTGFLPTLKKFERTKSTPTGTLADTFIDYWRLYISFSYLTIKIYLIENEPSTNNDAQPFNICTPGELNRNVLPLLAAGKHEVRKAALSALGCIQIDGYGSLLRDIQPFMSAVIKDSQSSLRKQTVFENAFERMRTQLAHLLTYVANFTQVRALRKQQGVMKAFQDYIKAMFIFFSDSEVQTEWKHQITRFYFCTFIEKYYKHLSTDLQNNNEYLIEQYLDFRARRDLFSLFEGWCGFGVDESKSRTREATMISQFLKSNKDSSKIQIYRKSIQIASLKAMAALCRGPLVSPTDSQLYLDVHRIITWINGILESKQTTYQSIAKSAIENILESNVTNDYLITEIFNNCYSHSGSSNLTTGYFLGLVKLVVRKGLVGSTARMVTLCLFQLGSGNPILRKGAGSLFLVLGKRLSNQAEDEKPEANDLYIDSYYWEDISTIDIDYEPPVTEEPVNLVSDVLALISSSTVPAIYKKSQLEASKKLALEHPELAMDVLNEVTLRAQLIKTNSEEDVRKIRNLILILTTWLSSFKIVGNFSVDRTHEFTSFEQLTWNILYNLFYLTAQCSDSDIYTNDIQEIWTELLNVKSKDVSFIERQKLVKSKLCTVSDFLAVNAFSLQSSRAINVTKTIAIVLASSEFGACLIDHVVGKLTPKSIAPIADSVLATIINHGKVASRGHPEELSGSIHSSQNSSKLSLCYLYMLQLIDCSLTLDKYALILFLPTLLHITITQLDGSKSEEMRLLLVFLIQSILSSDKSKRKQTDPILKALNLKEGKALWKKEDPSPENPEPESTGQLTALTLEILDVFSLVYPLLRADWTEVALKWGTTCNESHTACRSLQITRALKPQVSSTVLAQLAQALSVAVSDARSLLQNQSLDILLTMKNLYHDTNASKIFSEYPHFFWISLALLSSVHEWEYKEGLSLLGSLLSQTDLSKPNMIQLFISSMPSKWPHGFHGVLIPLTRGLVSSKTCDEALNIINSLLSISVPSFLDTRVSKMLFIVLANLPKILQPYEYESGLNDLFDREHSVIEASLLLAENIAVACSNASYDSLAHLLNSFSNQRIRKRDSFLRQMAAIIRDEYRVVEGEVVQFCLSLLTNSSFMYPNCFLSLLEILWQDQSQRAIETALPTDITGAWLRPLISLLDSSLGYRAARLLDVMLSVRLKANESDITRNVGGAQNIYSYVKKPKSEGFTFLPSGWLMEDYQSETAVLTKKRLFLVAKSLHGITANNENTATSTFQRNSSVSSQLDSRTKSRLLTQFDDHKAHFQSSVSVSKH